MAVADWSASIRRIVETVQSVMETEENECSAKQWAARNSCPAERFPWNRFGHVPAFKYSNTGLTHVGPSDVVQPDF